MGQSHEKCSGVFLFCLEKYEYNWECSKNFYSKSWWMIYAPFFSLGIEWKNIKPKYYIKSFWSKFLNVEIGNIS